MSAIVTGTALLEYGTGQVPMKCRYSGETLRKPNGAPCLPSEFPNGIGIGGMPLTWTGRLVAWKDWDTLSEWDRYGPQGRMWNGITREWEQPIRAENAPGEGLENGE